MKFINQKKVREKQSINLFSLLIFIFLSSYTLSQKNVLTNELEYTSYIGYVMKKFKKINNDKYHKIKGLVIVTDINGKLIRYNLVLINKTKLLPNEYDFIFDALNNKNYVNIINKQEPSSKNKHEFKIGLRYSPPAQLDL